MNPAPVADEGRVPGEPPWETLRRQLVARSEAMAAAGDTAGAAVLHALVESWWLEQAAWDAALREALKANHEINNALVGVSGNVQLLLLTPAGQQPGVKERLHVILREAERVERASRSLGETKAMLGLSSGRTLSEGEAGGGRTAHAC